MIHFFIYIRWFIFVKIKISIHSISGIQIPYIGWFVRIFGDSCIAIMIRVHKNMIHKKIPKAFLHEFHNRSYRWFSGLWTLRQDERMRECALCVVRCSQDSWSCKDDITVIYSANYISINEHDAESPSYVIVDYKHC